MPYKCLTVAELVWPTNKLFDRKQPALPLGDVTLVDTIKLRHPLCFIVSVSACCRDVLIGLSSIKSYSIITGGEEMSTSYSGGLRLFN